MITNTQNIITMIVAMVLGGIVGIITQLVTEKKSHKFVLEDFSDNNVPAKMVNTDSSIDDIIEKFELIEG